jgi:hypothetical protein
MNWDVLIGLIPEVVGLLAMIAPVRKYFAVARREKRAQLISVLAQDALALIAHQKGVSLAKAAELQELIREVESRLLGAGVDPAKVAAIAKSAVAGALAKADPGASARRRLLEGAEPVE